MLTGLESQLAANGPCTYFAPAPRGLSDAELAEAAQMLHEAGKVCMWGLSHSGSKYSRAFLAYRICDPECYPHYREAKARDFVWLTGFVCTLLTALLCFFGQYVFPGYFWPAMGVAAVGWLGGFALIRREQLLLRELEVPNKPVFGWVSYG
jgi:hypothetical protein